MKNNNLLTLAIDICDLTKKGWNIELSDNAFAFAYACHQDYGTVFFENDDEFLSWKKSQYQLD